MPTRIPIAVKIYLCLLVSYLLVLTATIPYSTDGHSSPYELSSSSSLKTVPNIDIVDSGWMTLQYRWDNNPPEITDGVKVVKGDCELEISPNVVALYANFFGISQAGSQVSIVFCAPMYKKGIQGYATERNSEKYAFIADSESLVVIWGTFIHELAHLEQYFKNTRGETRPYQLGSVIHYARCQDNYVCYVINCIVNGITVKHLYMPLSAAERQDLMKEFQSIGSPIKIQ